MKKMFQKFQKDFDEKLDEAFNAFGEHQDEYKSFKKMYENDKEKVICQKKNFLKLKNILKIINKKNKTLKKLLEIKIINKLIYML
jgi:hypothetical protein